MNDMDELISVIVPVYNIENYLPRCLLAIEEQTYRNLEIILVDDGSTDRSGILCDEFAAKESRARVIHQPNTGIWAARNAGHDAAHGEYLFFPDGDDYFHRDILRILHEAINSGKGYDLSICQRKKTTISDEDVSSPLVIHKKVVSQEDLFQSLFTKYRGSLGPFFAQGVWNKLFRRKLIENHRNKPYPIAQDIDFLLRLYPVVKEAILVDNDLYYWVQHSESITHSSSFPLLRSMCHVRMNYQNYQSLPDDGRRFGHFLLENLYTELVFWIGRTWKSTTFALVSAESRIIIHQTQKAYLFCREIPLWKRVACLSLVRHPHLAHWLIRVSGN